MSKELERITGDSSLKRYFETDYIGAYSIDEGVEPVLTIDSLWHGDLTLGGGRKEHHVIIKFKESRVPGIDDVKPMILNATNRKTLKKVYGGDTAGVLEGKKIQLYIDPKVRDPQEGGFTEGLRIRQFAPRDTSGANTICADCGKPITAYEGITAQQLAAATLKKYSRPLCYDCSKIEKAKQDPLNAAGGGQLAIGS